MTAQASVSGTMSERHVLITGASGGIGAALSRRYAHPGTHLTLWGRQSGRLEQTAREARNSGASVDILMLDLCDADAALAALVETDDRRAVDILVLGAGLSDIRPADALAERAEDVRQIAMVNFTTPAMLASEAAGRMAARKRGRICLIGSVAAFHDLAVATAYSGSKAGLARFSTALHAAMTPHGVGVTLVSPGYVDTAMSQRLESARPFLVSPDDAARRIVQAVDRKRAHLLFPWPFHVLRLIEALTPRAIAHRLIRSAKVVQRPAS